MSTFIKRYREEAGLTQAQLAEKMDVSVVAVQNWENGKTRINQDRYYDLSEIFNVPVDVLIKEMLIEADQSRPDTWPDFLFDDDTNAIIDTLHLNLAQQDLFGLMYIYGSEYLKKTEIDQDTFDEDLKRIPYGFIDRVGSIRFMNQAEGLHKVIRYVRSDFLMKVLKQNPDSEFNIRKLSKNLICEFIDEGYKPLNDSEDDIETYEGLYFGIDMRRARILLPVLEEIGPVHITDGRWSNPVRNDLPEEFLNAVLEMCGFRRELWEEGHYEREYNVSNIKSGLETVTDYKNTARKEKEERWMLSINKKGRELLQWLRK
ncbi:MAG: helix-turn-helix transcriptional regulator [Eubacterium sp.]|nr:helix-turn-helix transcriptional regulator [Eubacterium sp.]